MSHGYIASGGIGNRVAAISSFIYDRICYKDGVSLVWENSYLGGLLPEQIWDNWNVPYTVGKIDEYNCLNWYIHANACKNRVVKEWWMGLIPNIDIRNGLLTLKPKYECAISIRNFHLYYNEIKIQQLKSIVENISSENILITSDNNDAIINIIKEINKTPDYYKTEERNTANMTTNIFGPRSYNEVVCSLVDWYALQRCNIIYKNNPISTFTEFAEHFCNIRVEAIY